MEVVHTVIRDQEEEADFINSILGTLLVLHWLRHILLTWTFIGLMVRLL